jgi:hypothetical protein
MGKYGTNLEGFGAFEGGVNADKGAPLVSTSSDGETALLFGPAALREIQAGCANGDFAIPPDAAGDTITDENPLPYWTWTPATGITAAIVTDSGSGSANVLRVTSAIGTYASDTFGVLSRVIPIATSRARDSVYVPLVSLKSVTLNQPYFKCTYQYLTQAGTNTGTAMERAVNGVSATITTSAPDSLANATAPADAAYLKISISIGETPATVTSPKSADLCEVRVVSGNPFIYLPNKVTPSVAPAVLEYTAEGLQSSIPFYTTAAGSEFADLELTGNLLVGGLTQSQGGLSVVGEITATGDITAGGANSNLLARITATAAQSLTNNTLTKITFNTASATPTTDSYDPQTWFDNANDRIVIGQDGFYNITANVGFATNTTSRRLVQIFVNGSDRGSVNVTAATAGTTLLTVSTNVYLVATDYVEVHALQQSGGALNTVSVTGVYPVLSVGRIGA